jgi:hypothetical protein
MMRQETLNEQKEKYAIRDRQDEEKRRPIKIDIMRRQDA